MLLLWCLFSLGGGFFLFGFVFGLLRLIFTLLVVDVSKDNKCCCCFFFSGGMWGERKLGDVTNNNNKSKTTGVYGVY